MGCGFDKIIDKDMSNQLFVRRNIYMIKNRKVVSLYAALLAVAFLLSTGCSSGKPGISETKQATSAATSAATSTTAAEVKIDPFGKYDPGIELEYISLMELQQFPQGQSIENNIWTNEYKEKLGINLKPKWTVPTPDQYAQRLNIAIASNELPDLMHIEPKQLPQLVENDKLEDLTPVFGYASPDLKKSLESNSITLDSATIKGKLMGMPVPTLFDVPLLWIRADWMEKLGLTEPKSMDDVIAIAKAFAEKDPDGNGKADTYWSPPGMNGLMG